MNTAKSAKRCHGIVSSSPSSIHEQPLLLELPMETGAPDNCAEEVNGIHEKKRYVFILMREYKSVWKLNEGFHGCV